MEIFHLETRAAKVCLPFVGHLVRNRKDVNRISFLNRGYAFKGLLAVYIYPVKYLFLVTVQPRLWLSCLLLLIVYGVTLVFSRYSLETLQICIKKMSLDMGNWSSEFPTRSETKWFVQSEKMARRLKFAI